MKNVSRRTFLKLGVYSLATASFIKNGGLIIANSFAKMLDEGVKKMKYVHELKAPLKGPAKSHQKKLAKELAKHKDLKVDAAKALPNCKFCQFWEEPKDGWGYCRYVAKKGNKQGQKAYSEAWCQMFKPEKKADKLKKQIAAAAKK